MSLAWLGACSLKNSTSLGEDVLEEGVVQVRLIETMLFVQQSLNFDITFIESVLVGLPPIDFLN